jgi:hypothetical protein
MSAKTATRQSEESLDLPFSEDQALKVANSVLSNWDPTDATRNIITAQEVGELQRLLARAILTSTAEAAHRGSVLTINEVILSEEMSRTEDGEVMLHLKAVAEGKRVETLIFLLRDVDQMLLALCSNFNDLVRETVDDLVIEKLTTIRQAVMKSEEVIRKNIELNSPEG